MTSAYFFKDVSLLITHYNRSSSLEHLLKACKDLNYGFQEIVVSDDGSNPEHLKVISELQNLYNFRLITTEVNKGLGNNINKGQAVVTSPYTLYVQEDFVPLAAFGEHFMDAMEIIEKRKDLDIIRFYSYIQYPHVKPCEKGFFEMIYKPWSLNYLKIYYYSDHPHLRRSNFIEKFGPYTEQVSVDRSEYRMCISFLQQRGKGLFYNDYQNLFEQKNPEEEPSTTIRGNLTLSKNPIIKFIRDIYRQFRYNYDLRFLRVNHGFAIKSDIAKLRKESNSFIDLSKAVINKFLSVYVRLRYPGARREFKQFYKDTYYCQIVQLKYIFKDFISRKKYKTISFNGEFAPELQFVLPFAYWHFKNGTLDKTQSSKFSKELYFFSPNHEEIYEERSNEGNYNFEIPRILYSHDYNIAKWTQVPLKDAYRNNIYVYDKPILIIANRYNMEWDDVPVSFLSIPVLDSIIKRLRDRYTIIYNRPRPQNITVDNSVIYDLHEFEWLEKEHPDLILMEDLFKENKANANNFNHLQLMVYANASHFISTHGGTGALASYFGGINLILSKKGPEHHFKCYEKLYPKLSGATIYHAKTDDELFRHIDNYLIDESYVSK
ncbi:MAG: glycosyltransferase family 2 protein [Pedobacter sp.]|jgi:glycosyltransferase involved in cell wall biosynthesis